MQNGKIDAVTEDVKNILFTYFRQRGNLTDEELFLFLPSSLQILSLAVRSTVHVLLFFSSGYLLQECVSITDEAMEHVQKTNGAFYFRRTSMFRLIILQGKTLTSFSLVDCSKLTDSGFEYFSKRFPLLQKLDLTGSFLWSEKENKMQRQLKFRSKGCTQLTERGIDFITSGTLFFFLLSSWIHSVQKGCPVLNEVDFSECCIGDSALYAIMKCKTITILTLADCNSITFCFQSVPDFFRDDPNLNRSLKSLCMRHTLITDESVKMIVELCPELRILDLRFETLKILSEE